MTRAQRRRKRVAVLERRASFLERRIREWAPGPRRPSFELAELAALRYALGIVAAAVELDVVSDLELHAGCEAVDDEHVEPAAGLLAVQRGGGADRGEG